MPSNLNSDLYALIKYKNNPVPQKRYAVLGRKGSEEQRVNYGYMRLLKVFVLGRKGFYEWVKFFKGDNKLPFEEFDSSGNKVKLYQ